ncbi:MAG: TonB-dependent receptor [bacterium]
MNRRIVTARAAIVLLLASILMVAAIPAFAGRIMGSITNAQTGEPLVGVNIILKGTYKGASTDLDGNYVIMAVNPGSYDLQASSIGYKLYLNTDLRIEGDEILTVDIALEPTVLSLGQEIVIIGERPLLDVDQTATSRTINSKEINELVVEGLNDVIGQQVGVVKDNSDVHIRGGRADENMYIIDNLSVKDPISGQGLGVYISAEAVKEIEVITGGFNAEYGQAMSGLVNVETKEGGDEWEGSFQTKTDNFSGWPSRHQNTNNVEFSLGGPDPITSGALKSIGLDVPGKSSIFLNGYGYVSDTYLPNASGELVPIRNQWDPFALREENNYSIMAKYTYKPIPTFKISYNFGRSLQINQGYFDAVVEDKKYFPLEYMDILSQYNTISREGIQHGLNITHTLSRKTFYELTLGNFYNRVTSAPLGKYYTDYTQPVDNLPVFYDVGNLGEILTKTGDGLWDVGNGDTYHDHYNDTFQLKWKLTSQANSRNLVKIGIEYEQTKLQSLTVHDPWVASTDLGGDYDMYSAMSEAGTFYAQDKIEFKGMIANVGLRFDWWNPGKYVEDAIADPNVITLTDAARQLYMDETSEILGRRIKSHLSPRLGVSHPVTDSDVLFFNYGHFSQRPKYAYVFSKLRSYSPSTYQLFGNPNLNPQTTVSYEMGIKHRFTGNQVLEISAFYKDLYDYATSFQVTSSNPRLGNISYYQYFNQDYARVRGLEMRFRARQGTYWSGNVDFAYQIATGKSSSAAAAIQAAADTHIQEKTLGEEYLAWDTPIRLGLTVWLRVPPNSPPHWFGINWPTNWGGSVRWDLSTGKRYTPIVLTNEGQDYQESGERYSELAPWWNTVDIKLYKEIPLAQRTSVRFFIEALNAFDFKVPNQINALTGHPYERGDPAPVSWENAQGFILVDPGRYKAPRQVFFGTSVRF